MVRHSKQVFELAPQMQAYFGRPVVELSDEEIASFLVAWGGGSLRVDTTIHVARDADTHAAMLRLYEGILSERKPAD